MRSKSFIFGFKYIHTHRSLIFDHAKTCPRYSVLCLLLSPLRFQKLGVGVRPRITHLHEVLSHLKAPKELFSSSPGGCLCKDAATIFSEKAHIRRNQGALLISHGAWGERVLPSCPSYKHLISISCTDHKQDSGPETKIALLHQVRRPGY